MTTKNTNHVPNKETQSLSEPTKYILRGIEKRQLREGRPVIFNQRNREKSGSGR